MSDERQEYEETETLSRSRNILKMFALDGTFDLKQGVILAIPMLLLIVFVIILAPWVVEQQKGVQVTQASLTYPELLASVDTLASSINKPMFDVQVRLLLEESAAVHAVRSGRMLTRVPLLMALDDRTAVQEILQQFDVEKTDAPSELSDRALIITQGYFKNDASRAYFELGVWLEKALQSVELKNITGDTEAVELSFKERKRILSGVTGLSNDEQVKAQLLELRQEDLQWDDTASIKHWHRLLLDLAASF